MGRPLQFSALEAARRLAQSDARLAGVISQVGPFRISPRSGISPFEVLTGSIIHQQLNGAAAAAIQERFRALLDTRDGVDPKSVLRVSETRLRSVGLSRSKVAALKDLAAHAISGTVPTFAQLQRMNDEEIVEILTVIRGVGRWTVEMLLIFHLGRPDVLPVNDYGIRRGFALVYSKRTLPSERTLARHAEKWRPFRSVASWYLWRALELSPADLHAARRSCLADPPPTF